MVRLLILMLLMAVNGFAKPINCTFKLSLPPQQDSFQLEVFKCYLSNFRFYSQSNELIFTDSNAFLIELSDSVLTHTITIDCPVNVTPKTIVYSIGLDSVSNTSGALSGALDPLNGMFWTWQSGYIHLKLEGKFVKTSSPKTALEFHLGGYRWPNATLIDKQVDIKYESIIVDIQLSNFLKHLNKGVSTKIMSPGPLAKQVFNTISNSFVPMQP
jgi:hypothetical protein